MLSSLDDVLSRGNDSHTTRCGYRAGVYSITNTQNGKRYIGSSSNLTSRLRWHIYELKKGRHHSRKLLNAWNKYGEENFDVRVELLCAVDNLVVYEQILIDYYRSAKNGYNVRVKAESNQGLRYSTSTRKKMAAYAANRPKEHNMKISHAREGVPLSEAHRRSCREAHLGLKYPNRKKGYNLQETHRLKIVAALTGRPVSDTTKEKMRVARQAGATGEKGVTWDKARNKYSVVTRKEGKRKYVGRFATLDEAKQARDRALLPCT